MKRSMVAGAAGLCLAAATGLAQAQSKWYLGADVVQLETKITDQTGVPPIVTGSAKATTLRLKGGGHLTNWLDLELQGILPSEETYSNAGTTNKVETSVFAVLAKPNANFGPVNVYGAFGWASSKVSLHGVLEGDKSFSDLAFGVGAQYRFNRNLAVSADWMRYGKKNLDVSGLSGGIDVDVSAFGVGINYTF
jgi:opacity protein-like surface antigen